MKLAAEKILNGEIIIYPTDTLYGLGVDATNCKAIDSLNKLPNDGLKGLEKIQFENSKITRVSSKYTTMAELSRYIGGTNF